MLGQSPVNWSALPEVHPGMLIVKVQASEQANAVAAGVLNLAGGYNLAAAEAYAPKVESLLDRGPGLRALEFYHRQGLVRNVTALAAPRGPSDERLFHRLAGPGGVVGAMMATLGVKPTADASEELAHGVSFVELDGRVDVDKLRAELADDPSVAFASEVPCRYLTVQRIRRIGRPPPPPASPPPRRSAATGASEATVLAQPPADGAAAQWNLERIRWRQANALGHADPVGIKVAVLDTGVDRDHPDLAGRIASYVFEYPSLNVVSGPNDLVGHGTHVAGTICANADNSLGIAGVANCQVRVWKIFDDQAVFIPQLGYFTYVVNPKMYHRALIDCIAAQVDVINLSIGGPRRPDPQEQRYFNTLIARDTVVVAAMGNERRFGSPVSYPAAIPDVVAVGATRPDDRVADFSNRGDHIVISAPGVAIWSTLPTYPGQRGYEAVPDVSGVPRQGKPMYRERDYDAWPGTSMAAPHVTAAVARLLARRGKMASAQVRQHLIDSAEKVPGMNMQPHHPDYGHGRLNLLNLLR